MSWDPMREQRVREERERAARDAWAANPNAYSVSVYGASQHSAPNPTFSNLIPSVSSGYQPLALTQNFQVTNYGGSSQYLAPSEGAVGSNSSNYGLSNYQALGYGHYQYGGTSQYPAPSSSEFGPTAPNSGLTNYQAPEFTQNTYGLATHSYASGSNATYGATPTPMFSNYPSASLASHSQIMNPAGPYSYNPGPESSANSFVPNSSWDMSTSAAPSSNSMVPEFNNNSSPQTSGSNYFLGTGRYYRSNGWEYVNDLPGFYIGSSSDVPSSSFTHFLPLHIYRVADRTIPRGTASYEWPAYAEDLRIGSLIFTLPYTDNYTPRIHCIKHSHNDQSCAENILRISTSFNHPVVVLDIFPRVNADGKGDIMCVCAQGTTYSNKTLEEYHQYNEKNPRVNGTGIPIRMGPQPCASELRRPSHPMLHLQTGSTPKQMYIRTVDYYEIPLGCLKAFSFTHTRADQVRFDEESYNLLVSSLNYQPQHGFGFRITRRYGLTNGNPGPGNPGYETTPFEQR